MIFTITWRPKISLLLCTAIRACPKPGTLNTELLASMEMLPTDLSFGPGSGSANVTSTADGWDYGSINDLERCGIEVRHACAPRGWCGEAGYGPPQALLSGREPAKGCQPSHTPCCHMPLNCQKVWLSVFTQCPSRFANTSSPDLIFPEIWLMLVLPPNKGCQGKKEKIPSV